MSPLEFGWRFLSGEGKRNAVDARHGLDFADVVGCANGGGENFLGCVLLPLAAWPAVSAAVGSSIRGRVFFFLVCV